VPLGGGGGGAGGEALIEIEAGEFGGKGGRGRCPREGHRRTAAGLSEAGYRRGLRRGGSGRQPGFEGGAAGVGERGEFRLLGGDGGGGGSEGVFLGAGLEPHRRGRHRRGEKGIEPGLVDVVEEREELVVVLLGKGIVLVVVAAGAFEA
jgi:hypothetical protein